MDEYLRKLRNNLEGGLGSACMTELIGTLDAAYRAVICQPPKGVLNFGPFLLICHKSMLSAATLTAQT